MKPEGLLVLLKFLLLICKRNAIDFGKTRRFWELDYCMAYGAMGELRTQRKTKIGCLEKKIFSKTFVSSGMLKSLTKDFFLMGKRILY